MEKASSQVTGFNKVTWGPHCHSYMKSAKKVSTSQFDEIITHTMEYMKATTHSVKDDIIGVNDDDDDDDDDDDIHANTVNHSSGNEEDSICKEGLLYLTGD